MDAKKRCSTSNVVRPINFEHSNISARLRSAFEKCALYNATRKSNRAALTFCRLINYVSFAINVISRK
jgi:hypothetical protein